MSRLAQAWERASAFKDATAGTGAVYDAEQAAMLGERWIAALFEREGLTEEEMNEAGLIVLKVGTDTFRNLHRMRLDPQMTVASIFASGFSNGLALGLELARK